MSRGLYRDFQGNIGIVGTPVIDMATGTLYVVTRAKKHTTRLETTQVRLLQSLIRAIGSINHWRWLTRIQVYTETTYLMDYLMWPRDRLAELLGKIKQNDFFQYLHALDITTGTERPNSPVVITAHVPGTGVGSSNGIVRFNAWSQNQRGALLLANNTVYITWTSYCDTPPYHGWIMGYDRTTLAQVMAKIVTPSGGGGGIWQSNSGPAAMSREASI